MKKRSLKLLSLAMSGVLTLSSLSSMTAFAAPEDDFGDRLEDQFEDEAENIYEEAETEETSSDIVEEDIESVQISTTELVPPTEVRWDDYGLLSFKPSLEKPMIYGIEVDRDGKRVGGIVMGDITSTSSRLDKNGIYHEDSILRTYFDGSGVYSAKVYVKADDSDQSEKVYAAEIPEINWIQPEERIATPQNLHWEYKNSTEFSVAVCDPIENAEWYRFEVRNEDDEFVAGVSLKNNTLDVSERIGDMTEHDYYFTVQAYSIDLSKYAHSLESEKSAVLTANGEIIDGQKNIIELGGEVTESNIDKTVQDVKNMDNSILKTALQTDQDAVNAIAKIEDTYTVAKNISILPAQSDVEKIDANKIEMTGAALNVSEGTVQLNVKDQKEAGTSIINTDIYTNIIAFDMSVILVNEYNCRFN